MSRHKFIKNLNLDDELDDYDGGEDYDYSSQCEGLSEEDHEKLAITTIAVRARLPLSLGHIEDDQIHDSLWHTYYDVDKTVAYLVKVFALEVSKSNKDFAVKPIKGVFSKDSSFSKTSARYDTSNRYPIPFSYQEFFKDTPWLNVPIFRQTTFIAPLSLRGGLLGGSGSSEPPKMSKLQTLVANRKKMAQQQKSVNIKDIEGTSTKLHLSLSKQDSASGSSDLTPKQIVPRSFPIRKRRVSNSSDPNLISFKNKDSKTEDILIEENTLLNIAKPSEFANTMFRSIPLKNSRNHFMIPCPTNNLTTDPFAEPSPDDIVLAAQSKAKGKGKAQLQMNKQVKPGGLIKNVKSLKIDDPPNLKSKNLDVLEEFKKQKTKNTASFVVIGHVDAGKSTLMGRLLLEVGIIDQRTVDRYTKEAEAMGKTSFALAWVFDQDSEERERGVTIDIALNEFETKRAKFTILDAPGHRDFIPNMIAGASQADFAVLVIDASTGSFESGLKGQTREHTLIVRSIGIQRLIIAVNKLDNIQWSQDRFMEIETQMSSFLTTAGYKRNNFSFVPCSGLVGDNISQPTSNPAASWYKGPTLVESLENIEPITHALTKPFRLTISNVFRGGNQNPVSISGRIEAGNLQVADTLIVQPSSKMCNVRALELDNHLVDWAVAGQNTVIHLSGIDEQYLKIGNVLCSPLNAIQNIKEFSAKLLAFEFLLPMLVDVHRGHLHCSGRIKEIKGIFSKASENIHSKKIPRVVKPGMVARVIVTLEREEPLEAPGRVVLRSNGVTVAAGLIE
ncbi:HBS1-like protein [Erysiphe neolycopersici]|uniref:Elongation factor 1 alpha-like protein n=1 Tax=Erysiphe neolycopersici TaxID=212602 RepID=A0A420HJQ2_9PEZI|nr:HBS1-like protein [Erysiphe neolycopersici]